MCVVLIIQNGQTALMYAVYNSSGDIAPVRYLVEETPAQVNDTDCVSHVPKEIHLYFAAIDKIIFLSCTIFLVEL